MRYLSDFEVGQKFAAGPAEVTADEIIAFARRYDPQPFHVDSSAAKETFFKGLVASGWLTVCLTTRLILSSGFDVEGGMIGREVEELKWLLPVRPGDLLRAESEVLELLPTHADHGWMRVCTKTINQKEEVVQTMLSCTRVKRRAGEG